MNEWCLQSVYLYGQQFFNHFQKPRNSFPLITEMGNNCYSKIGNRPPKVVQLVSTKNSQTFYPSTI